VLAGDAAKLRPLVEKKKYSSLLSSDKMGRVPYVASFHLVTRMREWIMDMHCSYCGWSGDV
jgi:hypothetical protein